MKLIFFVCFLWSCWGSLCAETLLSPYYHVKQISVEQGLPSSVICLNQDRQGTLWMATPQGIYRLYGDVVRQYSLPARWERANRSLYHIISDVEGRVWMVHPQGLCYYQPQSDSLQVLLHQGEPVQSRIILHHDGKLVIPHHDSLWIYDRDLNPIESRPLQNHHRLIYATPYSSDEYLVLDASRRLCLLDLRTGSISPSPFSSEVNVFLTYRDRMGRFWISSYGQGVKCFAPDGQLLQTYTTQNSNLAHDVVLDIVEWNETIWLATDGGGVQLIHPETQQVSRFVSSPQEMSLSGSVTSLYPMDNHLWVGTVRNGVFGVEKGFLTTYTCQPFNPTGGLSHPSPLCLWEDADGMLWIGTDGGGINRFDPATETFLNYPQTAGEKIVSICPYSSTELLISSYNKGLFLLNRTTGTYRSWIPSCPDKQEAFMFMLRHSSVPINLRTTSQGDIEMYGTSFYRYSRCTQRITCVYPQMKGVQTSWVYLGMYRSQPVFYDRRSVFVFHEESLQCTSLLPRQQGQILAAALDEKGRLWTSDVDGVRMTSLSTGHQEQIPLGESEQPVTSLVLDAEGTVWMGSLGEVFAYQPSLRHLTVYNEMDGVLPNDFLPKPVWATDKGHVYIGGSNGLLHINPLLRQMVPTSNIRLRLQEAYLDGHFLSIEPGKTLSVSADFESLQLRTFVEGGNMLHKHRFRFRVKGFHNAFVETSQPVYSLLTLPPGQYTLTAQCLQKDGDWSPEFPLLPFIVLPPWWLKPTFLLGCLLIVVLLVVFAAHLYDKRVQHRYAEQERLAYKDKVKTLVNIHHELRTPLTLVYAPLKQMVRHKQLPYEHRQKLLGVLKQAHQMKNTMDMILNLSKMEEESNILHMQMVDFNQWLQSILDGFKEEFALRDIQLILQADNRIGKMYLDLYQCEIVLNNLLGNAYKFSKAHTVVTVEARLDAVSGPVRISVCDQGVGLLDDELSHLFERFYQGKHAFQGIGIGLAYAKLLVEMQGGVIGARNNPDQGATFFFTLPYRQVEAHIEATPKAYLNGWGIEWQKSLTTVEGQSIDGPEVLIADKFHSVLLVEKDQELCHFLTCNLQALFEHVYVAYDGLEALPLLTSHRPQLVLSSVCMPRMDGLELCRYIKQKPELNVIPVVLLTSFVDDQIREEAYKSGAEAFVEKPFDMDLLLVQLQKILHNQFKVKQHYAPLVGEQPMLDEHDYSGTELLAQLNHLIRHHLDNPDLDVSFIAKCMGMSRAGLYNKTKGLLGVGISEYITQCRLQQAARLLQQTSLSIAEVSDKVGFKHSRNFSTLFKAFMGVSPSGYRKKMSGNPSIGSSNVC